MQQASGRFIAFVDDDDDVSDDYVSRLLEAIREPAPPVPERPDAETGRKPEKPLRTGS
jgi:hypothetical protein